MGVANAQHNPEYNGRIGINIIEPKATLHINSIETDKTKGILLPKQTGDELKTNSANLTAEQDGVISYITEGTTTPDGIASNVHFKGLHRFNHDNASWVRLEPSGLEKVRHNGKIGYRLVGTDPTNYIGLGNNAIDFSIRSTLPTERKKAGATGDLSIILGQGDTLLASGVRSVVIGNGAYDSNALGENSIVIGGGSANAKNAIAIGGGDARSEGNIAIGQGARASFKGAIAIGNNLITSAMGENSIALGSYSNVFTDNSVAIGYNSTAEGDSSLALMGGHTHNTSEIVISPLAFHTDYKDDTKIKSNMSEQMFVIGAATKDEGVRKASTDTTSAGTFPITGNALIILKNFHTGIGLPTDTTTPSNSKPTEMLDVAGNVRVRGLESPILPDTCNEGTITYYQKNFYGCVGNNTWKKLNND